MICIFGRLASSSELDCVLFRIVRDTHPLSHRGHHCNHLDIGSSIQWCWTYRFHRSDIAQDHIHLEKQKPIQSIKFTYLHFYQILSMTSTPDSSKEKIPSTIIMISINFNRHYTAQIYLWCAVYKMNKIHCNIEGDHTKITVLLDTYWSHNLLRSTPDCTHIVFQQNRCLEM